MYSKNLKKLRKELRYSIEEMAKILEIPPRTLGGYERDERTPSIELASQLCNKLNVNTNWFVTGKGEMFNGENNPENSFVVIKKGDIEKTVIEILKNEGIIK